MLVLSLPVDRLPLLIPPLLYLSCFYLVRIGMVAEIYIDIYVEEGIVTVVVIVE